MMNPHGPHAVYRHFDKHGVCLYVGCSHDPLGRYSGHRSASTWANLVCKIEFEWFPNRESALRAEAKAIHAREGLYNKLPSGPKGAPIANLAYLYLADWLEFSGTSHDAFAKKAGITSAEARVISAVSKQLRIPKAQIIALATDGYVPSAAWIRRGRPLRYETFVRLSETEAAAEVARINRDVEELRAWHAARRAA